MIKILPVIKKSIRAIPLGYVKKGLQLLVIVLLLTFYGSFLFEKLPLPSALDLPRQMENGKNVLAGQFDVLTKNVYSYVEPNQPFANHHWLSGVIYYLLYLAVGWNGMGIFKVVLFLLMFLLLFWLVVKSSYFWLAAFFSIPTIFILISRTALRPEMFSYFFAVLFLYFLFDLQSHPNHKRIFLLIPLQLLWVNMHLFFGTGVLMVAGFLFERLILNFRRVKTDTVIKKLSVVLVLAIAVLFINPFGLEGAVYSFWVNSTSSFPIASSEIISISKSLAQNPGWNNISALLFFPMVVALVMSFGAAFFYRWKKKENLFSGNIIFYFLACLGSGLIAYFVVRGLPFFGLMFLPAICNNIKDYYLDALIWLKSKSAEGYVYLARFSVLLLVAMIVFSTIFGQQKIMAADQEGLGLVDYSLSSADFFKNNNLQGPIFNDTDIGSYLIYTLYPKEKVFSDNRFGDAYSAKFFSDTFFPMVRDEDSWKQGMEKYHLNTIFFYHYNQLDGARDFLYRRFHDPNWALVYADSFAVIFVKRNEQNKKVISQYEIADDNIGQKLRYLSTSPNLNEQLAAADVFNLFGRLDLSMPMYLKLVSLMPHRATIWLVLGKTELGKTPETSNPYIAALYLERAIAEGQATWESYSYLALAYFRTGQVERAKWAVAKELKIDPQNQDAQKWVNILYHNGQ